MTASSPHPPADTSDRYPSLIGGILSYLVPGLGQIYQGRIGKGLLFMVTLLGMFHLGQAMGDWKNVYMPIPDVDHREPGPLGQAKAVVNSLSYRWHFAGQVWIGAAAWPAIGHFFELIKIAPDQPSFWATYQRAPDWAGETQINEFLRNSDKTPDLGWVYTVVAGVLNILVIYDAFAGPAFGKGGSPHDPAKTPEGGAA